MTDIMTKQEKAVFERANSMCMADGRDPKGHWTDYVQAANRALRQEQRNRQ